MSMFRDIKGELLSLKNKQDKSAWQISSYQGILIKIRRSSKNAANNPHKAHNKSGK